MAKWRFIQIDPQFARGTFKTQYLTSKEWAGEIKYDGFREIGQFCVEDESPVLRITSRQKSKKDGLYVEKTDNVPHITRAWSPKLDRSDPKMMKRMLDLTGTVIDGEVILPASVKVIGGQSKAVGSIMGSLSDVAIAKQQERGWLRYVVFDCLWFRGKDMRKVPYTMRRNLARDVVERLQNPHIELAVQAGEVDVGYTSKRLLDDVLKQGGEGILLKRIDSAYGIDSAWVKKKFVATFDCVVMGYKDAKEESTKVNGEVSVTKLAAKGLIGAIRIGQYRDGKLWECGTISGMDDETREKLSRNGEAYIGKVVEVKAWGREPTGRFRHPQFVGFRSDKPAKQCTYRENEE